MSSLDPQRLTGLARFIRSQATLTDEPPYTQGPGSVKLNNEEAITIAQALDEYAQQLAAVGNPLWSYLRLSAFFRRHGIIAKSQPACFVCEKHSIKWPPAKQHDDLPNIIVCDTCYRFATAPRLSEPV
jgi:hypothetical protein